MSLKRKNRADAFKEDSEIVELYFKRDERAIKETERKYGRYLYSVIYNVLGDSDGTEECLDDTYIGVWNAIPPTRPRNLGAFLTAIARRAAIKRYHRESAKRLIPSEMTVALAELEGIITEGEELGSELESRRLSEIINGFVRSLPSRRQFIFIGRYYMSEPIDKLAGELELSRSMVNKELAEIRRALKEKLESEGYTI